MSGLAGFIVRHPQIVALCMLVLLAIAAIGMVRLSFNDGLSHVFSSQNQAYSEFVTDQTRFSGMGSAIAVHLQSNDFANPSQFRAAEEFALELSLTEGVAGVTSIFALRLAPDAEGRTAPIFAADLDSQTALREALKTAAQHPLNMGRLLTDDHQNLLVLVQTESQQLSDLTLLIDDIVQQGALYLSDADVRFTLTGMPSLRVNTIGLLIRDQWVINIVAAAIGFVLCLIAFKGFAPAMIAGLPAVMALVFVLGFMGFWGTGINTATNALPVLILVLAFADSMHLTFETRRRIGRGQPYQQAIKDAFTLAAPPCILASVTTAIAFVSLMLSDSELISGLGAAGSIGVMISLAIVLVVNPLLSALAGRFDLRGWTKGLPNQPLMFPNTLWQRVLDWCLENKKRVVVVGVAGLMLALSVYSQAGARYSFFEYVPKHGEAFQALQKVERTFIPLASYDVMVPISSTETGDITRQMLGPIAAAHEKLATQFGAERVVSLWSAAQWVNPQDPLSAGPQLTQLMARSAMIGSNGLLSDDGALARIIVQTPDPGAQTVLRTAGQINETLRTGEVDSQPRVGGILYLGAEVATQMIFDLNRSFLAAVVFSGVLIGVWMRSWRVGVVALIVNVLPIAMVGGFLVLTDLQLQFTSGLALTIAFGIAIDDTLHALNRLRPKFLAGAALTRDDIQKAFSAVAPVLTATSVILSFGLGATFLSEMPSIVFFGQLSIAVFLLALVADLLILPALLLLMQSGDKRTPPAAGLTRAK